jgi:hypothetical protein
MRKKPKDLHHEMNNRNGMMLIWFLPFVQNNNLRKNSLEAE